MILQQGEVVIVMRAVEREDPLVNNPQRRHGLVKLPTGDRVRALARRLTRGANRASYGLT